MKKKMLLFLGMSILFAFFGFAKEKGLTIILPESENLEITDYSKQSNFSISTESKGKRGSFDLKN